MIVNYTAIDEGVSSDLAKKIQLLFALTSTLKRDCQGKTDAFFLLESLDNRPRLCDDLYMNPFDELDSLLAHDDSCDAMNPYRPNCIHDDRYFDLRMLLCTDIDDHPAADADAESDIAPQLATLLDSIYALASDPMHETMRHRLSLLLLDHSLCPMHHTDYAICFDDRDDECASIRAYFPMHDT